MYHKIITIVLILGLSPFTNALFFGLFSSKPTPKPDVIVSEPAESQTDRIAYENYLRSLASTYPQYPSVQYVPVYPVQRHYTHYVQPQPNYIQHPAAAVQSFQPIPVPVQLEYSQTPHQPTKYQFQKPITVLPSAPHQQISPNILEATQSLNKLIEAPSTGVISKTLEYEIPEAQMPTTLYDLPVSGIAPDFRTGGYVTKTIAATSPLDSNKRFGRKFSHAYTNGEGTKVSEEGQLVHYRNGQESVVKRGQYEYIDATGNTVLVKWIADDDGFRLVK